MDYPDHIISSPVFIDPSIDSIQETNRGQIGDNSKPSSLRTSLKYTDALESISRLTGHQRKVFFYIFDQCFSTGTLLTGPSAALYAAEVYRQSELSIVISSLRTRLFGRRFLKSEFGNCQQKSIRQAMPHDRMVFHQAIDPSLRSASAFQI